MASAGSIRIPIRLTIGDTEHEIGDLPIDVDAVPVPGDPHAVSISAATPDIRAHLVALLRAAADRIEQGGGG